MCYISNIPLITHYFNFMHNTESFHYNSCGNLINNCKTHEAIKTHITQLFNRKAWSWKPQLSYYVSWRSYENIIQTYKAYHKLSVQYNCHTLIRPNLANPCTDLCHLLACLHCAIQADYKDQFNVIPLSLTEWLSLATQMYM